MKFIDEATVIARSGNGGPGCVSFRREAHVPRGGPDGGHGGRGGHVYVKGNSRLHSLLDLKFKKKYAAPNGLPGKSNQMDGPDGTDLVVEVPPGTVIRNRNSGEVLADIIEQESVCLLKGGRGGKGNSFYKSSIHQAPQIAQKGEEGDEIELSFELKLIADIGIVGLPNAGKSTLISAISAAKPKIADYPFTTLTPNLGVVSYHDGNSFVVADIPGLIEGASDGVGLGFSFLKHIERTKALLHVVDLSSEHPREDFELISGELKKYDEMRSAEAGYEPITAKPRLVVLNKTDLVDENRLSEVEEEFSDIENKVAISGAAHINLKSLIDTMATFVWSEE